MTRLQVRESNNAAFAFGCPTECFLRRQTVSSRTSTEPGCLAVAGTQYRMCRTGCRRAVLPETTIGQFRHWAACS